MNLRSTNVTVFLAVYVYPSEREMAIYHYEAALEIASSHNWDDALFWAYYSLAILFFTEGRLVDANAHIERAKSHVVNNAYHLALAMELQVGLRCTMGMFEEAKFKALRVVDAFEKLGATARAERTKGHLRWIETKMSKGKPPEMVLLLMRTDFLFSAPEKG